VIPPNNRLPDFEIQFRAAEGIAFPFSCTSTSNLEPNNPDECWTVVFLHQFTHIMIERHDQWTAGVCSRMMNAAA
jgi:hypothetical protein